MTPARASGVSFLENEMALRSVLVPEPGCQGGRAPGPMQAPQEEACPLPEHVASPSPWTRTGGACVHEGRERLFVSEGVQTKHTKSRRKKEDERHRPRVAHEARCVLSAFAGGSPPGGSPR